MQILQQEMRNICSYFLQWLSNLLEAKKQKSIIASLDGVRAIACLSVVTFHLSLITTRDIHLWSPQNISPWIATLAYAGDTGVTLFFILSGFLLFMPYAKALLFDSAWPQARHFYLRRALRILPAYYVTLFLMILIYSPDFLHTHGLGDLFMFLILFMDSSPTTYRMINGPFWSLAVEWQFYLLLPLLALGIALIVRRFSPQKRLLTLLCCLSGVIVWGVFSRSLGLYLTQHPSQTFHLPHRVIQVFLFFSYGMIGDGLHGKFLEDFGVGMLVSTLYIFSLRQSSFDKFHLWVRRLSPWLFVCGLLWLYTMFMWKYDQQLPQTYSLFDNSLWLFDRVGELGYSIGYGLCIAAILFGSGWLKQIFEWTPLRWIGLLSYGIYMWHLKLLGNFTQMIALPLHDLGWKGLVLYNFYWGWFLIFIIPCALILFALVEKPWIQLGNQWTRRNREGQFPLAQT